MEPKLKSINSINSIQKLSQLLRESTNDAVFSTKIQNRIEKLRLKNKKIKNVEEPTLEDTEEEPPVLDAEGKPITLGRAKQLLNKYCTNYNKKVVRRKSPTELDIQMIEKHINNTDNHIVIDEEKQGQLTLTPLTHSPLLKQLEEEYDFVEIKLVLKKKLINI